MDIENIILSAIFGGLIGGLLNIKVISRIQKNQFSMNIVTKVTSIIENIEDTYEILRKNVDSNGLIAPENYRNSEEKDLLIKNMYDRVAEVGDYFDMISYFYLRGNVNSALLENMGVLKKIRIFANHLKNFKTSEYNANPVSPEEEYLPVEWKETWPNILDVKLDNKRNIRRFIQNIFA